MVKFKGTEKDKGTGEGDRRCWPEGQGVCASCASPRVQASVAQEVACVLCLGSLALLGSRAVGLGSWAHSSSLVSTVVTAYGLESSV